MNFYRDVYNIITIFSTKKIKNLTYEFNMDF